MLNIKNLAFSYSGNKDVVSVNELNVKDKGLYSIIGMNGAGKTTLLKIIAGILKYRGSCTLENREVKALNAQLYPSVADIKLLFYCGPVCEIRIVQANEYILNAREEA